VSAASNRVIDATSISAEILALGPSCVSPAPQLNANSLCGRNSVRPFKGIFCADVSEFGLCEPRTVSVAIHARKETRGV
jgi:hypothetical protein